MKQLPVLLALLLILIASLSCLDEISKVTFPDPALEAEISTITGKQPGDIGEWALRKVKHVRALSAGISDLTGLDKCSYLVIIELSDNQISDISPLSNLTELTTIILDNNLINDITPLSKSVNPWILHLENNQITDISPLSKLTRPIILNLSGNRIVDIFPLVENENIGPETFIDLRNNPLSDTSVAVYIPQLVQRGADVRY